MDGVTSVSFFLCGCLIWKCVGVSAVGVVWDRRKCCLCSLKSAADRISVLSHLPSGIPNVALEVRHLPSIMRPHVVPLLPAASPDESVVNSDSLNCLSIPCSHFPPSRPLMCVVLECLCLFLVCSVGWQWPLVSPPLSFRCCLLACCIF